MSAETAPNMDQQQRNSGDVQLEEQHLIYAQQLDSLSQLLPEIEQRREAIEAAGTEIVDTFNIEPRFFEDEARSLVFTAIADRWAKSGADEEGDKAERLFLADSIALLAYEHSPELGAVKDEILSVETGTPTEEAQLKVYERFTDEELSKRMQEAVDNGLINDVKESLGINNENETPYKLRVMSLANDGLQTYGLAAPKLDLEMLPDDIEGRAKATNEYQADVESVKQWQQGLIRRGEQFKEEVGESHLAMAWISSLEGETQLCISMPLAEKLLDPELTANAEYYKENDYVSDLATLKHEYVHTQGGLYVDGQIFFGIGLEELRAEHFSGNKQGYQDIKRFYSDYAVVTGQSIPDLLEKLPKGGSITEVYSAIAQQVGLDKMLEVVMVAPQVYQGDNTNKYANETQAYLGGYDGITGRLLEQLLASGKGADVEARLDKAAQNVADVLNQSDSAIDVDDWVGYQRAHGSTRIVNMIAEKAKQLLPA